MNLKERFDKLGLSKDAIIARIEGVNKSVSDMGTWFTFVAYVLVNGKFETLTCKLNAGKNRESHVTAVNEFFTNFKAGDYQLTNLGIRVEGETWEDEEGNKVVYKQSYINVPFPSDMIYLGENTVENLKAKEAKFKRMEREALAAMPE